MRGPSVEEARALLASSTSISRLERVIEELSDDPRAGVQAAIVTARTRLDRLRAERSRLNALYKLESQLRRQGYALIAGVDEVGRGALAGPLTAAAVILPQSPRIDGVDDSKHLTPERREELADRVRAVALGVSVAHVPATEIDAIGIANAVRRAMTAAIQRLPVEPDHVVVDGLPVGIAEQETAVVKGDSSVAAVAAASIVAKVSRDALMRSMAPEYPAYGFDENKGYGTSEHMRAIAEMGLSDIHRRSFGPCGGTLNLF